jgi:hypothetical protein
MMRLRGGFLWLISAVAAVAAISGAKGGGGGGGRRKKDEWHEPDIDRLMTDDYMRYYGLDRPP